MSRKTEPADNTYASPFSTRYGTPEMRALWSEHTRRRAWRRVWTLVAEVQAAAGLVTPEQVDDIRRHSTEVDLERAGEIEREIGHDLVAELRTFAEQCEQGGAVLHWGLTSADIQDNVEVARQRAALAIVLRRLRELLLALARLVESTADLPVMGYTHLQPAEPTTLGYRLASYAQDLLSTFEELTRLRSRLRGKGIRGSVGTAATLVEMLDDTPISPEMLEASVMEALEIDAHLVSTQTYPRLQDFWLLSGLAGLAAALHKFAFDLRVMQSPGIGPTAEPFGESQVGSSAMPFKRNPVMAEKICSLARLVAASASVAWENAATALLERTLDDSANRRSLIPEALLASEEMLSTAVTIVQGMEIDEAGAAQAIRRLGPLVATERVLSALVREGADRQAMHERLRRHALEAQEALRKGNPNPLPDTLSADTAILRYLQPARVRALLDASTYVGLAPERARQMASRIREQLTPE